MLTNHVFIVDQNRKHLNPIHPARARNLLDKGKAAVLRLYPFTLILKTTIENPCIGSYTLKIDPGSKFTGFAIVNKKSEVIWAMELEHRGHHISEKLVKRAGQRRSRRQRHTQYRQPGRKNNTRPLGWLAPSLQHRVDTTITWVNRICRLVPITQIEVERVKFDLQKLQNPEIDGIEYQQGTLFGYEVREYLLEKWCRQCSYCGAKDVTLEIDHIHPKSKGGSDRVSNLTLACHKCNQAKGNKDVKDFLVDKPDVIISILSQAKQPLKDAAAVNSTRNALFRKLSEVKPTRGWSGGMTKYNRTRLGLVKQHWIDASCVGEVDNLVFKTNQALLVKASGHGTRQFHIPNDIGLIDKAKKPMPTRKQKIVHGFRTGDMAKAIVTKGKKVGTYVGRVAVRTSGSFNIQTSKGTVQGLNYKCFRPIHRGDGYNYSFQIKEVLAVKTALVTFPLRS